MEKQEVAVEIKAGELAYSSNSAYAEDLRIAKAIAKGIDKYISKSTLIVNPDIRGLPSG